MRRGACGKVLKQAASDLLIKSIHIAASGEFWLDKLGVSNRLEPAFYATDHPITDQA